MICLFTRLVTINEDVARGDLEAYQEMAAAGHVGKDDTAILSKIAVGKVKVEKLGTPAKSGGWKGLSRGASPGSCFRRRFWPVRSPGLLPALVVDPYIGVRHTDLDVALDLTLTDLLTGIKSSASFKDRVAWTDPIIGARSTWELFRRWNVILSGDAGGFGVGSDLAWSATALGGYRFNFSRHIRGNVLFGYRALYQDYTQGSGSDRFEYAATMHGPVVGLAIGF